MRSLFVVILIAIGFTGSIFSRHIALLTYVWFSLFRPVDWVYWNLVPLRLSLVSGILLLVPSLLSGILPNITHPLSIASWLMLGVTLGGETLHLGEWLAAAVVTGSVVLMLSGRRR